MSNTKFQIFVSSTYKDLINERQAAVEAILKAGHIPAGMELFAAGDESQLDTIKRWIDSSDVYMLILGTRYGSLEPKTGFSYVELEYDYAISTNKPIFAVVTKDTHPIDHPDKYALFRKKVLSKTCSFFEDSKDIKLSIHESIQDIQSRLKLNGWVPASEIPDTKKLIDEINRLQDQNTSLIKENEKLKNFSEQPNPEKEFQSLFHTLSNIKVDTSLFDKSKKIQTYTLLHIFTFIKEVLVTGVINKKEINEQHQYLYFDICPKLQIYGLVINERVPSVQWRRFSLASKGSDFLAYIERVKSK